MSDGDDDLTQKYHFEIELDDSQIHELIKGRQVSVKTDRFEATIRAEEDLQPLTLSNIANSATQRLLEKYRRENR